MFCLPIVARSQSLSQRDNLPLVEIAQKADQVLRKELNEHWYPRCIEAQGGYHENFAADWTRFDDTQKSIVAQSRHLWTTSRFAQYSLEDRDAYTAYAKHGFEFLKDAFVDREHGGLFWAIESPGKSTQSTKGLKHVYGIAFAIYASVAYFELTHDEAARKFASDNFDWLEQHAHDAKHGGYMEQINREGKPIESYDPQSEIWQRMDPLGGYFGFKSMNTHIHLLEAFAELAKIDSRPIVRQRLREVFLIVRDRIAVEPGVLCLFFTPDWRATAAHDSFGHDIETAYLLIEAAEVLDPQIDAETWRVARLLVDHALEWGWDHQFGGFYDKGEAFSEAFDTDKVWWVQAEGLNILGLLHQHFGDETDRYREAFVKQWSFIDQFAIDHKTGGWFMETTKDGKPKGSTDKSNAWKCSYHTSRALMNVVKMFHAKK